MSVAIAAAGIGNKKIRISEEVDRLLRITAWIRECLETELQAGLGTGGKHGIDTGTLKKFKEAVLAFNSLADAQIRLDKSAKAMAEKMTPEEELEAVRSYVRSLDPKDRNAFLIREREWHEANVG